MEKNIIREFVNFLEVFENITKYLQREHYPTTSTCIYFYESIFNALDKVEKDSCFDLTIKLCDFAKTNFEKRFKILKIYLIAALMEPVQKNWALLYKYLNRITETNDAPLIETCEDPITKEDLLFQEINKFQVPVVQRNPVVRKT